MRTASCCLEDHGFRKGRNSLTSFSTTAPWSEQRPCLVLLSCSDRRTWQRGRAGPRLSLHSRPNGVRGADCKMTGGATACTGGQLEGMWKESAVACIPTLRQMDEGRYEISERYLNLGPPQYEVRKPLTGFPTVNSGVITSTQPVLLVIFINRSQHSGNYIYHLPQYKLFAFPSHSVFVCFL